MAAKIRTNDEVIVITGRDKGRIGRVTRVFTSAQKVLVEGVNLQTKHQRPNPARDERGEIITREAPVAISNVALYNPETKRGSRVGFRFENGKKVRYFKSTGTLVPNS